MSAHLEDKLVQRVTLHTTDYYCLLLTTAYYLLLTTYTYCLPSDERIMQLLDRDGTVAVLVDGFVQLDQQLHFRLGHRKSEQSAVVVSHTE